MIPSRATRVQIITYIIIIAIQCTTYSMDYANLDWSAWSAYLWTALSIAQAQACLDSHPSTVLSRGNRHSGKNRSRENLQWLKCTWQLNYQAEIHFFERYVALSAMQPRNPWETELSSTWYPKPRRLAKALKQKALRIEGRRGNPNSWRLLASLVWDEEFSIAGFIGVSTIIL